MMSLTLSQHRSDRSDLLLGVGASLATHAAIVGLMLFLSNLHPAGRMVQFASTTVNLVSLDDMGGGGKKLLDTKPAKGKEVPAAEPSDASGEKAAASSAKIKPTSLAPVKRLQLDEPVVEKKLAKMSSAEAPDIPSKAIPSLEESVEKLIPKTKAPPPPPPAKTQPVETRKPANSAEPAASPGAGRQAKGGSASPAGAGAASSSRTAGNSAAQPGAGSGAAGTGKGPAAGPGNGQEGGGQQSGAALNAWSLSVYNAILRGWLLPPSLKSQELAVALVVRVRKDGKVVDIKIDKNSGNSAFDEAAVRAVRRADPLPAIPEGSGNSEPELYIRFTPRGVSS